MGKYLNILGTRCIHCGSHLYPMDLVQNPRHLYPIGIIYRCGNPCNRTRIWTNSIRGGSRGYADLINYLEGRADRFSQGICNDQYCAKCWGYVQCLRNGYDFSGSHRRADLFGCPKPECDNRYAAWTDRFDVENPDVDDERAYYSFYRFYARHLSQMKEAVNRNNPSSYSSYRRNSDTLLRLLERRWQSEDTPENKLRYNAACVRAGIIPPPDVDMIIFWKKEDFKKRNSQILSSRKSPIWSPKPGETIKKQWQRWFFPNGFGVSVAYSVDDPHPGRAPWPHQISPEEHESEGILFTFDIYEFNRVYVEKPEAAGQINDADFSTGFHLMGLKVSFLSHTVTRFISSDKQKVLELLVEAHNQDYQSNPIIGVPIEEIPESSCDCHICQSMCHRTPCWPTPQEAEHLLQMGYGDRLDLEYFQDAPPPGRSHEGWYTVWAVVPKLRGTELHPKGCTFQDERGLCELHGRCKPLEGRLAHHSGTPFSLRAQIAALWDTPEGRRTVNKFKALGY